MAREWIERLISEQRITSEYLTDAKRVARQRNIPLETVLVESGRVRRDTIRLYQILQFEPEWIDLDHASIAPEVIESIPNGIVRELGIIPLYRTASEITVAVPEPVDEDLVDKLCFILNTRIRLVYANRAAIASAVDRHYPPSPEDENKTEHLCEFVSRAVSIDEAFLDRMLTLIVGEAISLHAQTIHWDPGPKFTRIHYLIAGEKLERHSIRTDIFALFCSRILSRSGLSDQEDISSQQGRLTTSFDEIERTVTFIAQPSEFGWSVTIEIPPELTVIELGSIRQGRG